MKILFAWDFHGTLEKDNVKAVQEMINLVMQSFRIDRNITIEETSELYGMSWIDYFKFVYPEGNIITWNQMKDKAEEIQGKNKIVEKYIRPQSYAKYVLKRIKDKGHYNLVISNSDPKWLKHFIKLVKIDKYVDDVIGLDLHGAERSSQDVSDLKAGALKKYLKQYKFDKVVRIGDHESDIRSGQKIKATTYFFRNKFNQNQKLSISPDYEISDLRKLFKEIKGI